MKKAKESKRWPIFRKEGRLPKSLLKKLCKKHGLKINTNYIVGGV